MKMGRIMIKKLIDMFEPSGSSKKNREAVRSASPLSDNSSNSAVFHVTSRTSKIPGGQPPRATAHGGTRERAARDKNAGSPSVDVLKRNQRNVASTKTAAIPIPPRNDKAWSGGGSPASGLDMKSASVRKTPPQRRPAERIAPKPAPLKDHNGRLKHEGPKAINGVVSAPVPIRRNTVVLARTPPSNRSPPAAPAVGPTPEEVAAEVQKRLLPQLRHSAAGFEALGVLVNYMSASLDAFSTPQLKKELEKMKTEWLKTKSELDEAQAGFLRLEQQRVEEQKTMEQQRRQHEQDMEELRQRLAQEQVQKQQEMQLEMQERLARELDELNGRHASEVASLRQQLDKHSEHTDAVSRSLREEYEAELDRVTRRHEETLRAALGASRAEAERELAGRTQEAARTEAELQARLHALEAEHTALKEQSRRVMESMKSDKGSKVQALAARCQELEVEVQSHKSVLELRINELQDQRRLNDVLRRDADQLPAALQKVTSLTARVEDLQLQLERKTSNENQLFKENAALQDSICQETNQKKWLSLHNEELQWKLKQKSEIITALANMSGADVAALSLSLNLPNLPNTTAAANANGWGRNNCEAPTGMQESFNELRPNKEGRLSPPDSPAIKGVVEKSDSVSWVLEMEAAETFSTRLMRRTGSCRSSTPVSSPAHARSLPPPSKRQCCPPQPLAQSASATAILSRPQPKQRSVSFRARSRSISSDSGECLSSGNWSPPASLPPNPHPEQNQDGGIPHAASATPESARGRTRTPLYDCSDIEDFSSSKSSSMSCSSEGSELGGKEVPESGCYQPSGGDVMTTSCGSNSELLLSSKQATLPKDAAGEAMISEEMTEDDAHGMHSSCDGSCSEEDSNSSEGGQDSSPSIQPGNRVSAKKAYLTLPITDSATQSANNTPMDSSWSEDMELLVSLSES